METTENYPHGVGSEPDEGPATPGLLLVFADGKPRLEAIPIGAEPVDIGRAGVGELPLRDVSLSRKHARVTFAGGRWTVRDLGSRNGTFVDRVALPAETDTAFEHPTVLRVGLSLFLFCDDVRVAHGPGVETHGNLVVGPRLRRVLDAVQQAAASGGNLHICGPSGSGKELLARALHQLGPASRGPLVAVNCAAVPPALAERLFFGARKGAYSGADTDIDGYLQSADRGTLFLDEIAELNATIQAKLLRVLQDGEVLPLGASQPRKVNLRVCSATLRSLRKRVAAHGFREDLYFRIGRPEVEVPPLLERPEEIPWLLVRELARAGTALVPTALFVEACLGRPWPGNVRELLTEARRAAQAAVADRVHQVDVRHLPADAGNEIMGDEDEFVTPQAMPAVGTAPRTGRKQQIEEALRVAEGNASAAARALGVHRTQLRRWLERYAIDPRRFGPGSTR